jgi:N-acyl amino acid synthase of PEP-CTERM/exosortase system
MLITTILDAFNCYFEMVSADTEELKQEVYKLRYQVYCLERGFLDMPPDGLEHDEYDEHSCHYLIRHRESQTYMATTRLILPNKKPFPMEANSEIDNIELVKTIPRNHLAELSRFCVSKQFRRRANEQNLIITNDTDESRLPPRGKSSSASITLSLFACAIQMSVDHNIQYWYAIMEPASKRIASALGIYFVEVGSPVDYHGIRVPYAIKVADILNTAAEKSPEYWAMLTNDGKIIP